MSGIAGIWYLDGDPSPLRHRLHTMLAAVAHRGPDRTGVWVGSTAGFAHCMLATTPEALREVMPLQDSSDSLVLTADARIDNREELVQNLGLDSRASDGEIILAAYRKWGEDCPQRLLGDFAFAIWDSRRQHVFCARDHFGVRPFHYHHRPGGLFAFASELKGMMVLPEVPRELDEWWILGVLTLREDDLASTVYDQVSHLPPAHTLTVRSQGAVLRRYWSLDPELEVSRRSPREYEEEFRAIFVEAVRCRLRSATPVGATLSGGLDSSAIACAAREVLQREQRDRLHTFSLVFDETPQSDERSYIRAVLEQGGLVPHFVAMDELRPVEEAMRFAPYLDAPMSTANAALSFGIQSAARQAGTRVVLDGFFGDDAISHGLENFAEMMRARQYLRAAVTGYQYARNFGAPLWWVYKRFVFGPAAPAPLLRAWKRVRPRRGRRPRSITALYGSLVNEDFRSRAARYSRDPHSVVDPGRPAARRAHYRAFVMPYQTIALQTEDLIAAAYGVEVRFPFFDKRVVEFAYALPPSQKVHGGWSRSILRRSLADLLPPSVCWRTNKADLSHWYVHQMAGREQDRLRRMIEESTEVLEPYVNLSAVRDLLEEATEERCSVRFVALWHPLALALWLRSREGGISDHLSRNGGETLPTARTYSPLAPGLQGVVSALEPSTC